MVNKDALKKNTAITRQLIRTARTLEADGGKGDESNTGRVWAYGIHHVRVDSYLARVLKIMNCLFL